MVLSAENILLIGAILLFISIITSKTSFRLGIPTLIFFLVVGMLAGYDGPGGIYFDNPKIAQFIGIVALNFILFSGGLETSIKDVKPVFWRGLSLSTLGVLITAVVLGSFVSYVTPLSLVEGLLLGSIVSSTDAAAVFSILRTQKMELKGSLRPTLEFESGSNDPMAYMLMLTFLQLVQTPDVSIGMLVLQFFQQLLIGAVSGWFMGKMMVWIINRIKLDVDGLYPVLLMALLLFAFSATDFIGGNGFLAIYIAGIILGNSEFIHKKSLIHFFDGQAWLMQIVMFLTLGLLVFPTQVFPLIGLGLLLSAFFILVARPISVFLALAFFKIDLNKRLFISWVGLRGAVPIVFATYPLIAGVEHAQFIFNIVFFISITSVLLQGTTLPFVARLLKVNVPEQEIETAEEIRRLPKTLKVYFDLILPPWSPVLNKKLFEVPFPQGAYVTMVKRGNEYFIPQGSTSLQKGDHLFIATINERDKKSLELLLQGS